MTTLWDDCKEAFREDGSLRDIYVQGTSLEDWDRFYGFLLDCGFSLTFARNGEPAKLPSQAAEALQDPNSTHNLMIGVENLTLNCHFFTEEEIELDVDPREVHSQSELDLVLGFMRNLGKCLSKEVILTAENFKDLVWFQYLPESDQMHYDGNPI